MNEKIIEFLLLQNQLTQVRKINSFYRGDSLESIFNRFGITNDGTDYKKQQLLERIFLIGDKSKYFYENTILKFTEFPRDIELTNIDDETLSKIFLRFNSATKSTKDYMKNYFNKNKSLFNFFKTKLNKDKFINTIKASENPLFYRNYYLKILHQLYHINYRNNSHFVSTSYDKKVTRNFTGDNGIIIHCWQPSLFFFSKKFDKLDLPKQTKLPFKEQKEFSFLAGILPHYISAIEFINEKKIYFNPTILESDINFELFFNGLDIDQTRFTEVIVETNFRKYFTRSGLNDNEFNISK